MEARCAHRLLPSLALALTACASGGAFRAGSVIRSIDNDTFDHSDDLYTSGLSVSHVSPHLDSFEDSLLPEGLAAMLDERSSGDPAGRHLVILSLSQKLFTPTDLSESDLIANDLPYSALLYGTATVGTQSRDELHAASLSVGVVGPLAGGELVQSTVHRWIGSEQPEGWDNQLKNEVLLNVGADYRRRLTTFGNRDGWGGDLLLGVSGSAGNIQTQASIGATARLGKGVPTNFQMPSAFLSEESLGIRPYDETSGRFSAYLFGGFVATGVANAIYLDGNTFTDSHSVSHDHYVLRVAVGTVLRYGKVHLALSVESASVPYDHPDGLDHESYGRFGLTFDL